ncbi:hypothetical protein RAS14_22130 [Achromobacter aegrifaciens]|uniref:hypothetical protein n=1 Tax=Achromobacter aegrifaciens TaxID=1287736 RepID=UPI0027940B7E|nr:hypothetical protein [Achromobacter aegrifaciens]MDQ1762477.1 hypothetical protein [Achromobacter aegrifaciens]
MLRRNIKLQAGRRAVLGKIRSGAELARMLLRTIPVRGLWNSFVTMAETGVFGID